MRLIPLLSLLGFFGCAPATYLYSFDISDPGAVNYKDARRPDSIEDADTKIELRCDPTEFKAIVLEVTNKTESEMSVNWGNIFIVGPDREQRQLSPLNPERVIMPTAKINTQLQPFELPAIGGAAKFYDNTDFEIILPLIVRGQPHEYRYHLHVTLKKI